MTNSQNANGALTSPSVVRNRDPILAILRQVLPQTGTVLEIACGTGEHAVHFAAALPHLTWQPTDYDKRALNSITAHRTASQLPNLLAPLTLDASAPEWPVERADAIVAINMVHISPWQATQGLMSGAGRVLPPGGVLYLYGAYKENGTHTSPSNEAFDEDLRHRNPLLLTPVLLSLLTRTSVEGGFDLTKALGDVVLQLLVPFATGQIARPWLAGIMARHEPQIGQLDQGVILLIVYTAFSQSVVDGLWSRLPPASVALTAVLCLVLLTVVLSITALIARRLGFSRRDEIAAVFCGSKKSLASGLPLAKVLFATAPGFGMIVLPIMFYNQIQILVGAVIARRYARDGAMPAAAGSK